MKTRSRTPERGAHAAVAFERVAAAGGTNTAEAGRGSEEARRAGLAVSDEGEEKSGENGD
jgi:hypothetical protein